jgi:hypothetical protein
MPPKKAPLIILKVDYGNDEVHKEGKGKGKAPAPPSPTPSDDSEFGGPPAPMASPEFKALEADLHRIMSAVVAPPAAPPPISPPDTDMSDASSSENSPPQQTHAVIASSASDNVPKPEHPRTPKWAEIGHLNPFQKEFASHFTREIMKPLTYKLLANAWHEELESRREAGGMDSMDWQTDFEYELGDWITYLVEIMVSV